MPNMPIFENMKTIYYVPFYLYSTFWIGTLGHVEKEYRNSQSIFNNAEPKIDVIFVFGSFCKV